MGAVVRVVWLERREYSIRRRTFNVVERANRPGLSPSRVSSATADGNSNRGMVSALTCMYQSYIIMHMRTTLNIDDDLLAEAGRLRGIMEKTALVRAGLDALIARESAKRLAVLGASQRVLRPIPRRRTRKAS